MNGEGEHGSSAVRQDSRIAFPCPSIRDKSSIFRNRSFWRVGPDARRIGAGQAPEAHTRAIQVAGITFRGSRDYRSYLELRERPGRWQIRHSLGFARARRPPQTTMRPVVCDQHTASQPVCPRAGARRELHQHRTVRCGHVRRRRPPVGRRQEGRVGTGVRAVQRDHRQVRRGHAWPWRGRPVILRLHAALAAPGLTRSFGRCGWAGSPAGMPYQRARHRLLPRAARLLSCDSQLGDVSRVRVPGA